MCDTHAEKTSGRSCSRASKMPSVLVAPACSCFGATKKKVLITADCAGVNDFVVDRNEQVMNYGSVLKLTQPSEWIAASGVRLFRPGFDSLVSFLSSTSSSRRQYSGIISTKSPSQTLECSGIYVHFESCCSLLIMDLSPSVSVQ